jgi:hypothetical protein
MRIPARQDRRSGFSNFTIFTPNPRPYAQLPGAELPVTGKPKQPSTVKRDDLFSPIGNRLVLALHQRDLAGD